MEDLFHVLSSSARLKKAPKQQSKKSSSSQSKEGDDSCSNSHHVRPLSIILGASKQFDEEKAQQIHREQVACFRRSMNIRISKQDPTNPDPISSFSELSCPQNWWNDLSSFDRIYSQTVLRNVEKGKWKEPTAIQMQALPCLVSRQDVIGAAPTGSGKSGAFLIPTILLSKATDAEYYGIDHDTSSEVKKKSKHKKKHKAINDNSTHKTQKKSPRSLLIAPSLELASQLHREVDRLSHGMPFRTCLLSKANAAHVISGEIGGAEGLHVLVATPLRLVDSIQKGLELNRVRIVILDEADRLLDAADGNHKPDSTITATSGSAHSTTFLSQMDAILSQIPSTAVRALFSATVSPTVRLLAESILRNPVDITIQASNPGGANPDITQKLVFVGKEQGKLLAIRQMVAKGELRPPVLVFCQSQERAQALFDELLYDRIHIDVLHAGRSKAARDQAVAKFRQGSTWVLICTDLVARGVDFRAVNMVINYDLPESGITYIHRIGRTGRAGRQGTALTLFTEADFGHLRTIANIMKQSGCQVEEWMLNLRKRPRKDEHVRRSGRDIDTTPKYDRIRRHKKQQIIQQSKDRKDKAVKDKHM